MDSPSTCHGWDEFGCGPYEGEDHAVSENTFFGGYKLIQSDGEKGTLDRQVYSQQQLLLFLINMYKSMVKINLPTFTFT
jgi:hypothetical protein